MIPLRDTETFRKQMKGPSDGSRIKLAFDPLDFVALVVSSAAPCQYVSPPPPLPAFLYRFPIGGLSFWSLGRAGEDKPVDLSSSPSSWVRQQGKDMVTHWKLPEPVCVRARRRGGWHAGSGLHHTSEACDDTWLSLLEREWCSYSPRFMGETAPWRLKRNWKVWRTGRSMFFPF